MGRIFYATVTLIISLQAIFIAKLVHNLFFEMEVYNKISVRDNASALIIVVVYAVYVSRIIVKTLKNKKETK